MPRCIISIRCFVAMCAVASLAGCAAHTAASCPPGSGSPVEVFTLFFGTAIPRRGDLTDQEWRTFLDTAVSANLPNGYSVFDANGGWTNPISHKTIKEGTKVLLVALPDVPASLAAINRVRVGYQIMFQQQMVGMTVENACGEF